MRLVSRLGQVNLVRRGRPLTVDELAKYVSNSLAVRLQQTVI